MEKRSDDYKQLLDTLHRRTALDSLRREPSLKSPEEEGKAAARRILEKISSEREAEYSKPPLNV